MAAWDFLQNYQFGFIFFPDARPGQTFLPSTISNGDLDGDLYFVCWDEEILRQLAAFHADKKGIMPASPAAEPYVHAEPLHGCNSNCWPEDAQQIMCNATGAAEVQTLIAKCYKLSKKLADASSEGMDDPNAVAFATAYEDALLYEKYGAPIRLPKHLHVELPEKLRKYVTG